MSLSALITLLSVFAVFIHPGAACADDIPNDPTKPSYFLYRADLALQEIQTAKSKYTIAAARGNSIQTYLNQHPELEAKNKPAYDALRKKEYELARAYAIGKSMGQCASQRQLSDRIYRGALNEELPNCIPEQNKTFADLTAFAITMTETANKAAGIEGKNGLNLRPELPMLRKQVYLDSLANGINNQLEIDFKLSGYPHTKELVDRTIDNLINERCTQSLLCTSADKAAIRSLALKYAEKAGFTKGAARADQDVVDQFCKKFTAYKDVKTYYQLANQEKTEASQAQDERRGYRVDASGNMIAVINPNAGSDRFTTIRSQQVARVKTEITMGYRTAALDLMQKGEEGLLMMGGESGKEFRIPFDCLNPKNPRNLAALKASRENLIKGIAEHAMRLNQLSDPLVSGDVNVKKQLAQIVKANPGAFAQAVGRNPALAGASCDVISEVNRQDVNKQNIDRALMIGGMVIAGALIATGVGAVFVGAGAAIAGAVTVGAIATGVGWAATGIATLSLVNHNISYRQYDQESRDQIGGVVSHNGDEKTFGEAKENHIKSDDAKNEQVRDVVQIVLSPLGGSMVNGIKGIRNGAKIVTAVEDVNVVSREANAVNAVEDLSKINTAKLTAKQLGDKLGVSGDDLLQYATECAIAHDVQDCIKAMIMARAQKGAMHGITLAAGKVKANFQERLPSQESVGPEMPLSGKGNIHTSNLDVQNSPQLERNGTGPPSIESTARIQDHVLRGEFEEITVPIKGKAVKRVVLQGGMHTESGLQELMTIRPDLQGRVTTETLPNGVILAKLPRDAFGKESSTLVKRSAKKGFGFYDETTGMHGKALFPKAWTNDEIQEALVSVVKNGVIENQQGTSVYLHGEYRGVKIQVTTQNGKISSGFPMWDQHADVKPYVFIGPVVPAAAITQHIPEKVPAPLPRQNVEVLPIERSISGRVIKGPEDLNAVITGDDVYVYVINKNGNMVVAKRTEDINTASAQIISTHRSAYAKLQATVGESEIVAAGEFVVDRGIVSEINNKTGSFRGGEENLTFADKVLSAKGLKIEEGTARIDYSKNPAKPHQQEAKNAQGMIVMNSPKYRVLNQKIDALLDRLYKLSPSKKFPGRADYTKPVSWVQDNDKVNYDSDEFNHYTDYGAFGHYNLFLKYITNPREHYGYLNELLETEGGEEQIRMMVDRSNELLDAWKSGK